jgi:preprotein translocase subunit Sec63
LLGVSPSAGDDEIKKAYRKRSVGAPVFQLGVVMEID